MKKFAHTRGIYVIGEREREKIRAKRVCLLRFILADKWRINIVADLCTRRRVAVRQ